MILLDGVMPGLFEAVGNPLAAKAASRELHQHSVTGKELDEARPEVTVAVDEQILPVR